MTARWTVLAITVMVALGSCKRTGSDSVDKAGVTSPVIGKLLAGVPGDAMALGFVDMDVPPWTFITGGVVPLDEATRKTLDKELREYVERYLGVDVSKLQHAVGFVSGPPPRGAVLLKAIGGALKLPGAIDHEGGKLWVVDPDAGVSLAMKGDIVVLGKDESVRDVLATLAGKRKSVAVENRALVEWLQKETRGAVMGFAAIAPKGLPLPPPIAGLQRVAVSMGRTGVRAVVDGEEKAISSLQALVDQAFATMIDEADRAHDAAIAGQIAPPEGAFAIIGATYAKSFAAKLKPRREGNRLTASLDPGLDGTQAMTVVGVVGILAAVAIPAFMDYLKKSKQTEASLHLNKLGINLRAYFHTNGMLPQGDVLTPGESCCNGPNHKCAVRAEDWQHPIWQALDFQGDEPHLFQYRYHSDGKTAVVEAIGDLDCDNTTITYRLDVTTARGHAVAEITEPPPNTD